MRRWQSAKNKCRNGRAGISKVDVCIQERSITVILTDEHLRKMVDNHLLAKDELDNRIKMVGAVQKLVNTGLGLPDRPWHDWDDWVKGFDL